jgi:hypothetical protein
MGTEILAAVARRGVASADQAWSLVMVNGREAGRRIGLFERVVVAGRDPRLDIVLPDDGVSRLHCLVSVVNGEVVVEDLGSTNGTFVNGQRIDRRRPLPVGSSAWAVSDSADRGGRQRMPSAVRQNQVGLPRRIPGRRLLDAGRYIAVARSNYSVGNRSDADRRAHRGHGSHPSR